MESSGSGRGRKRAASEAAPEPVPKLNSRKSRRGDADTESAAGGSASSKEGKERKGEPAEPGQSKRTRSSAHAVTAASEDSAPAGLSRSAKEGKEAKKESAGGDSGKGEVGRSKSRVVEKQAEAPAQASNGAAAASASALASAGFTAASASVSASAAAAAASSAASAALAMAGAHPGDLFPSSGLRRLLADRGFDELPMAIGMLRGANSRFKSLLDGLKAEGDLARQEGALTELCDMLCMATEETLQGFSMDAFLPPLIALVNCEASPEIMLQACRGIAYILEAIPQASADIVRYGSIAPLCSKLMAIQYIDVAEQALMTLHKISKDHASHAQLLQARGVSAVLSYLDFFPLSVQRTGMETVSNMCKRVSLESLHLVVDSIPQLSQMLLHSDSKLVEHVCTAFCRLVMSLGGQKEALEQIAANGHGVVKNVWSLTSNCLTDGASAGDKDSSQMIAAFGVELCSQLLHMLAMLAGASPTLGMEILAQPDVGKVLRSKILLEKPGEARASENRRRSSMELSSRSSPQLLREIMALTSSLLPSLPLFPPKEPATDSPKDGKAKGGKAKKSRAATTVADLPGALGLGGVDKGEEGKAQWGKNHEVLEQFGEQLLEAALSMGSLSIDGTLRLDALTALCKLVHYMPSEKISKFLPRQQICELMSALLASESVQLRFTALILIHDLMSKCGDAFSSLFTREGIVYAVHKLQEAGPGPLSVPVKREEKLPPYAPPSWTMRAMVPAKSGNSMQEATEPVFQAMLAFVCERHLPASSGTSKDGERLTSVVSELRELGAAMVKAGEQGNEEEAMKGMSSIMSYFENISKVSTFEMRCSGVCENLIRFLSPDGPRAKGDAADKGDKGKDAEKATARGRGRKGGKSEAKNSSVSGSEKISPEALHDRWDKFITLAKAKHDSEEGVCTPAQSLVLKLVAALSNTDGFGSSPAPQQGPEAEASWSKQSRLITLPLRLRFERCATAKDSHKLKDYANPVVIDPLASISAIHDFLWPRVRRLAHEIPATPVLTASRSTGARQEHPASSAATSQERPRRGAATGKAAADESTGSPSARPKRDAKSSKGKGAATGAATGAALVAAAGAVGAAASAPASSSSVAAHSLDAHEFAAFRASVPQWAEDEMLSDGDGDGMPMHDMVAASLLGGAVDEEGFDHGDMEDDMDLDHDGEDEAMHAQRAQVLDIQLSNEAGAGSPPLPSLSVHGGSGTGESSTRDRGGASAARGGKLFVASALSARAGGRANAGSDADESAGAGASSALNNAGSAAAGSAAVREESGTPLGLGIGPHLRLSIGGKVLENHDTSIIEAVLMSLTASSASSSKSTSSAASASGARGVHDPRSALWGSKDRTPVHVIEYEPMSNKSDGASCIEAENGSSRMGLLTLRASAIDEPVQARAGAVLRAGSEDGMTLEDLELPASTAAMLRLVAVLQSIHADLPADDPCRVSAGELVVGNLSSKASCMIRDPLAVFMQQLPDWVRVLLTRFPFLVAHDVRLTFFDLEAFGLVRALKNAGRNRDGRSDRQPNLGHTQHRQKVRVGRQHIMESAKRVMEIYTQSAEKAGWTLEVEFSGEVGVGKGPTQEFFTFFCRELQQRNLGLWWDSAPAGKAAAAPDTQGRAAGGAANSKIDSPEHVCSQHGLFPAPMAAGCSPADRKKKVEAFQVMGWVCAKAMHDGRLLDLPMSTPLCHTLLDRPLELGDMALVCPEVYKTLLKLMEMVRKKRAILKDAALSTDAKAEGVKALTYDGVALEDLSLYFTVPGHDAVVLKEGGDDILLTVDNIEEYCELLPRVVLVDSVRPQLEAFRSGFSRVFPIGSLRLFCGDELQELFGSDQDTMEWNPEQLLHLFKFEHGYKSSSGVARLLCQVLAELPVEHKRKFISFCTGCPRLPVGGFAALKPPLTVVKKELPKEASQSALDMQLPSVMTCANYLKLPDYASPTILRDRLLVAVNEADGSFHLS